MHPNPKTLNATVKSRLVGTGPQESVAPNWVADFVRLPADCVRAAFGTNGKVLHDLLAPMDPSHPDLLAALNDRVFAVRATHDLFVSVVGLANLAVDHGRAELLGPLPGLKLLHDRLGEIKPFARCIRDPALRDEQRRGKKPQVIDMSTLSRKGEELWNTQPASFESLVRFENAYADEMTAARRRAERFRSLGCVAMHEEVTKTVEAFQTQMAEAYQGFNRLTFNAACVILAKWHGYNLVTPFILSDFPPERNYKVTVEAKHFKGCAFFLRPEDADLCWPYSPRVYPLGEMGTLPPDVTEIVGLCENYHGFGGRPLFDHYAVMVPGIDYPQCREGEYAFHAEDGTVASFTDQNEARFALDKMLLAAGVFSAVVMGERDGKCYCLCVWS